MINRGKLGCKVRGDLSKMRYELKMKRITDRYSEDTLSVAEEMYRSGKYPLKEIKKKTGVTVHYQCFLFRKYPREFPYRGEKPSKEQMERMYQMYIRGRWPIEIGRYFGIGRHRVLYLLKKEYKAEELIPKTETEKNYQEWRDVASFFGPECSFQAVAEEIGSNYEHLRRWFSKFRIKNIGPFKPHGTKKDIDWKAIVNQYGGVVNATRVAKSMKGVSVMCVYYNLKKAGAKICGGRAEMKGKKWKKVEIQGH
jgi:hypothetical protein